MAELSTLARPYAKAAFEFARAQSALEAWSAQLATLAAVSVDEKVHLLLSDPGLTAQQQAAALNEVCGDAIDEQGRNFVVIVASNKRLALLPEILMMFQRYKANQEKTVDVQVFTALPLDESISQQLAQVLRKKLEREVRVDTELDPNLLGGVLVRAGDTVIDGSLRGRLNKLAEAMNS
jgi:F-type H+-transporting ATPase subunit delta